MKPMSTKAKEQVRAAVAQCTSLATYRAKYQCAHDKKEKLHPEIENVGHQLQSMPAALRNRIIEQAFHVD